MICFHVLKVTGQSRGTARKRQHACSDQTEFARQQTCSELRSSTLGVVCFVRQPSRVQQAHVDCWVWKAGQDEGQHLLCVTSLTPYQVFCHPLARLDIKQV